MADKTGAKALIGCIMAALTLCVQVPLFGLLLYGLLGAVQAPTWVWVIFWIYLPVGLVLGLFRALAEAAAGQ